MKTFLIVSASMGIGTVIGMYTAIKLEERYVLRPLNAYIDLCFKQFEKGAAEFKVVDDEKGEDE